ncbi:hypothetical protein [Microbacterium sp. MPKO10]|uniref:hypothetical protein n=1 Tax=Microbacterium sp. MPKO10 TaxID=2989818 RepID=UPI002235EFCE|nr:hypothetical protein [Microbacterium sp. MPKO10]MCW4459281.1 hypothetical protein [Microbacterium sp. MPKO10]
MLWKSRVADARGRGCARQRTIPSPEEDAPIGASGDDGWADIAQVDGGVGHAGFGRNAVTRVDGDGNVEFIRFCPTRRTAL